jgi:hypothetical protein
MAINTGVMLAASYTTWRDLPVNAGRVQPDQQRKLLCGVAVVRATRTPDVAHSCEALDEFWTCTRETTAWVDFEMHAPAIIVTNRSCIQLSVVI